MAKTAIVKSDQDPLGARPPARGAATIAERLRRAIEDGTYPHGTQLPTERALANAFAASRSTVRRALDRLEQSHLVVRQVGSGTYVNHPPRAGADEIAEITSPLELMEVRFAVEPQIARLAVMNATPRDLDRISDALGRLEDAGSNIERFTEWDQAFHLALAVASHNPLIESIYHQINNVRSHAQWLATKDKILNARSISAYNKQHRALYEALRRRDAGDAARVMQAHIDGAKRDLLGANSG